MNKDNFRTLDVDWFDNDIMKPHGITKSDGNPVWKKPPVLKLQTIKQQTKPVEEVKVEQSIKQEPTYQPNNSKFTAIKKSGYTFNDDIDGRKIRDTKYQTPKRDYFEVKFEDGTKQTMSKENFYKYYDNKK